MSQRFEILEFCQLLANFLGRVKVNRIWVAHSGGPDSTALVYALAYADSILSRNKLKVIWGIQHVNYGLRGNDSSQDEEFSRNLAGIFGVPFQLKTASHPPPSNGLQSWARAIRRDEWIQLGEQGDVVALAHHLDDVAENILFRMARGTSPMHLTGFKEWAPPLWRPFLVHRKKHLTGWLSEIGAHFRHDSSNDKIDYARNKIRHQVLPLLEEMFPGATERIAHLGFSVETHCMNQNDYSNSKGSQLVETLYGYYRKSSWIYPQISGPWLKESLKRIEERKDEASLIVPQSTHARGPFQTVLRLKGGDLKIGWASETRYKKKRYLLMSSGLFCPRTKIELPSTARSYQLDYYLSLGGDLKFRMGVTKNLSKGHQEIQVEPAASNIRLPGKFRLKTCKEFFQILKIKPELRCRWRVVKYDGKVVSLTDGIRSYTLFGENTEKRESASDIGDLNEVHEGRRSNNVVFNKMLSRGAYWMV
jgi:tRNA(Ile)-lysidine synthetase-like protein